MCYTNGVRIIAIDPGLERTGYALFENRGGKFEPLVYDCIFTAKNESVATRLSQLAAKLGKVLTKYKPERLVCEQLFFNTNLKTAIAIAQSQGVVMLEATRRGISVEFLTPLQVKEAVTGYGRADKKSVEKMIMIELGLKKAPRPDDVVDALAIGVAYCSRIKYDRKN